MRPRFPAKKKGMRPVPPGEILNEEFLKPLGLTANALAKAIGVPPDRITAILKMNDRGGRNPLSRNQRFEQSEAIEPLERFERAFT